MQVTKTCKITKYHIQVQLQRMSFLINPACAGMSQLIFINASGTAIYVWMWNETLTREKEKRFYFDETYSKPMHAGKIHFAPTKIRLNDIVVRWWLNLLDSLWVGIADNISEGLGEQTGGRQLSSSLVKPPCQRWSRRTVIHGNLKSKDNRGWFNADSMLVQRRRCWTSIESA